MKSIHHTIAPAFGLLLTCACALAFAQTPPTLPEAQVPSPSSTWANWFGLLPVGAVLILAFSQVRRGNGRGALWATAAAFGVISGCVFYIIAALVFPPVSGPIVAFLQTTFILASMLSTYVIGNKATTFNRIFLRAFLLGAALWLAVIPASWVFAGRIASETIEFAGNSNTVVAGAAIAGGISSFVTGTLSMFMVIFCLAGYTIAHLVQRKEHPDAGKATKKCTACAELILIEAKKCKHCGEPQSATENADITPKQTATTPSTRALRTPAMAGAIVVVIGAVAFVGYSSYQSRLAKQIAAKEKAELIQKEQKAKEAESARIAEQEAQRKQAELTRELERQQEIERLNAARLEAEAAKQSEQMLIAERQRLEAAQAKQKLLEAEDDERAWKKFYVITPKCQANYTLDCANVYMQKKQEFELYLAKKR